jgi:L-alanine-DL-glutamate epimerase-like enolase superfamily enzyme
MIKAGYKKHRLVFKKPTRTSREVMEYRDVYYLILTETENSRTAIGECAPLWGLSVENPDSYENKLGLICRDLEDKKFKVTDNDMTDFPSILFGIEIALRDFEHSGKRLLFPGPFTEGKVSIPINGLVWMSDFDDMKWQIAQKIEMGFDCIKIKVGAFDFNEEFEFLKKIRREYPQISLRLDANGAFPFDKVLDYLSKLSELDIHSIEQPIKPGNWEQMAEVL